jgi:hypothetical protein
MRALRKLVLGETVALPLGVALVVVLGLGLQGRDWWSEDGGFVLLALVVIVLLVSLAPAHRRR